MINLDKLSLMRGSQTLLKSVNLVIHRGQHIGVIGKNGCGKTSLFAAICGVLSAEEGEIRMPADLRCSMMSQETPGSERTAVDFVLDAHGGFRRLESALQAAEQARDDDALARLHDEFELIQGYNIKHQAEQLLSGLGFPTERFQEPVRHFSGGWRERLNLAAALMRPADLLLLDEPTNHLDLEATVWLEQWLQKFPGTLLLISHDRSFLDGIVDHVINFEGQSLQLYKGNYSAFEKQRAAKMALQQALFEKQQRRRQQIESFVRRFKVKASKARQAQSRLKELARMEEIAPAHVDSPFEFRFPDPGHLPAFLLQAEGLEIGFGEPLLKPLDLAIRQESRIGLLGFNGSGKSTLLKTLAGKLAPLSGELIKPRNLRIGYFAQHQVDELDQDATPLKLLQAGSDGNGEGGEQKIRDFLGGFDFRGPRAEERIAHFSGGEKARLALAKVAWERPNLLLMDEPTNHLDLEMCHALTVALQAFQGALVIVSHDRYLLTSTVDEFYSIHQGRFAEYKGVLSDYEAWLTGTEATRREDKSAPVAKLDKKRQRQAAASNRQRQAPLRQQATKLEKELDAMQEAVSGIEARLTDSALYEDAQRAELTDLLRRQGELKTRIERTEAQWFEVQEALGDMG